MIKYINKKIIKIILIIILLMLIITLATMAIFSFIKPKPLEINMQRAREIADSRLISVNPPLSDASDQFVIEDKETIEKPYGWIFFYTSKKFKETGDSRYLVPGNGLFVVNKDGTFISLSSSARPDIVISQYEKNIIYILKANKEAEARHYKPTDMDILVTNDISKLGKDLLRVYYSPRAMQLGGDITIWIDKEDGSLEKVELGK